MDVEDVDAALEPVALPPPLGTGAVANNAEMADTGTAAAESTTATEADEGMISTTTTTTNQATNAKSLTWKSIVDGARVIHLTSSPNGRLGLTLVEISNKATGMPCGLQIVAIDPRYCTFRDKVSVGDVMVEIDGREVTTLADATTKTSSTAGNEGRERSIIICKREYYLKDQEEAGGGGGMNNCNNDTTTTTGTTSTKKRKEMDDGVIEIIGGETEPTPEDASNTAATITPVAAAAIGGALLSIPRSLRQVSDDNFVNLMTAELERRGFTVSLRLLEVKPNVEKRYKKISKMSTTPKILPSFPFHPCTSNLPGLDIDQWNIMFHRLQRIILVNRNNFNPVGNVVGSDAALCEWTRNQVSQWKRMKLDNRHGLTLDRIAMLHSLGIDQWSSAFDTATTPINLVAGMPTSNNIIQLMGQQQQAVNSMNPMLMFMMQQRRAQQAGMFMANALSLSAGSSSAIGGQVGMPDTAELSTARTMNIEEQIDNYIAPTEPVSQKAMYTTRRIDAATALSPRFTKTYINSHADIENITWGFGSYLGQREFNTTTTTTTTTTDNGRTELNDSIDLRCALFAISRGDPTRATKVLLRLLRHKECKDIYTAIHAKLMKDSYIVERQIVAGIKRSIAHHTPSNKGGTRPIAAATFVKNVVSACIFHVVAENLEFKPTELKNAIGTSMGLLNAAKDTVKSLITDNVSIGLYERKERKDKIVDKVFTYIFGYCTDDQYTKLATNLSKGSKDTVEILDPTTGEKKTVQKRVWLTCKKKIERYNDFKNSEYFTAFQRDNSDANVSYSIYYNIMEKDCKFVANP